VRIFLVTALVCSAVLAQPPAPRETTFENSPAIALANDKLEITVTLTGASFARLALRDDPAAPNPLWEPARMARELARTSEFHGSTGHFICVDGFGASSSEEQAAGLPFHGEAHQQRYTVTRSLREGRAAVLTLEATLPIVQEKFTRTVRVVQGENVVYVESRLESLLGFDRPINWAEHATVGSPFLAPGDTVVDVSGVRSMLRPYDQARKGDTDRRLVSARESAWPLAPGLDGSSVDLRQTPLQPHFLDHFATLVDPSLKYGFVTALNTATHRLIGYLFRRSDFPWVQHWGYYPPTGKLARGLEFSTQPFDVSRREVLRTTPLFGAPVYRWLPAKSSIETRFLLFYTRVPAQMRKVDSVRLENGRLIIEDRAAHETITLPASLGL
jgi:hypothetical protein